jgi:hypothetical protein
MSDDLMTLIIDTVAYMVRGRIEYLTSPSHARFTSAEIVVTGRLHQARMVLNAEQAVALMIGWPVTLPILNPEKTLVWMCRGQVKVAFQVEGLGRVGGLTVFETLCENTVHADKMEWHARPKTDTLLLALSIVVRRGGGTATISLMAADKQTEDRWGEWALVDEVIKRALQPID